MGDLISSAVDAISSLGNTVLGDQLGIHSSGIASARQWRYYQKQAELDWQYYKNNYAPLQQQLQEDLFDYTSAGNYDRSLSYIGDSLEKQKAALLANGYNPILAVNGGASVSSGLSNGVVGSVPSVHSSSPAHVASHAVSPTPFSLSHSLSNLANVAVSAKQMDKMDAEQKEIQARTLKIIEETKRPGMAGDTVRTLDNVIKSMGETLTQSWHSAVDVLKEFIKPTEPLDYRPHVGPNWNYDKSLHRSIYVPDNQGR